MKNRFLKHHGIEGQKWGKRNGPPYPLNPARDYSEDEKKAQKKEFELAKKTQRKTYRSNYDRMLDYQAKSSVVQERSKELKELSEKAKDLSLKLEDYEERPEVYDEALKRSTELAKKDPGWGQYGEKVDSNLIEYYMYDGDVLKKTASEMNKKDPEFKKLKKEYKQTILDYKDTCGRITDEIIGKYGNEPVKGLGSSMKYKELVYYALSKPNTMWMFTWEEDMGRK